MAAEGDEWKKLRKATAPAFSEVCPIVASFQTGKLVSLLLPDLFLSFLIAQQSPGMGRGDTSLERAVQ